MTYTLQLLVNSCVQNIAVGQYNISDMS